MGSNRKERRRGLSIAKIQRLENITIVVLVLLMLLVAFVLINFVFPAQ